MRQKFTEKIQQRLRAATDSSRRLPAVVVVCIFAWLFQLWVMGALAAGGPAFREDGGGQAGWPKVSQLVANSHDWQTVTDMRLSPSQVTDVRRIVAKSIHKRCSDELNAEASSAVEKLSAKQLQIRANGPNALVLRGGADWEDTLGTCFCGSNLNCRTWVVSLSQDRAVVLLEYIGISGPLPLKLRSSGYFDLVTAFNQRVDHMELTMWRFDGKRYKPFRCASERYPRAMVDTGATPEEIDESVTFSEHPCK